MYKYSGLLMNIGGYCMGDDSDITDKVGDAPAGW
jgi:hypothetical protein